MIKMVDYIPESTAKREGRMIVKPNLPGSKQKYVIVWAPSMDILPVPTAIPAVTIASESHLPVADPTQPSSSSSAVAQPSNPIESIAPPQTDVRSVPSLARE